MWDGAAAVMDVKIGRAILDGGVIALLRVEDAVYRLADVLPDAPGIAEGDLDRLIAAWDRFAGRLRDPDLSRATLVNAATGAFLAPLERPRHLICIGVNYRDHIAEMGVPVEPAFPYAFLKPVTTIAPPAGPVRLPVMSAMVDWEAELGVVIGRQARDVAAADALDVVAGYLPLNDVSARDWVRDRPALGMDWMMQKGHDGFNPLGPWITLAGSVADPQAIPVRASVNGAPMQDSSTAQMVFSVAEIIAHLSSIMTLSPGDIIASGTPAGVGFGRNPPLFLHDGDEVEISMGQLGSFSTRFEAAR